MSNDYYTKTGNPQANSAGSSSLIRAEFTLIEGLADKLPPLTGNADEVVVVNGTGTGLTSSPAATLDAATFHAATSKTTPVDADEIPIVDSEASNVLKKLTWANLKATIKTYYDAVTSTLTNKTINLTSNTLSGTTAQFNAALSDNDFATLAGSETLTNKTLTSPVISGGTIDNAAIGGTTKAAGAFTTVSATGAATIGAGGTGATNGAISIDGSSASGQGAVLNLKRNSVTVAQVGTRSYVVGGTSDDLVLNGGVGVGILIGGVSKVEVTSTGVAVAGTGSFSNAGTSVIIGNGTYGTVVADATQTSASGAIYINSNSRGGATGSSTANGVISLLTNETVRVGSATGTDRAVFSSTGLAVTGVADASRFKPTGAPSSTEAGLSLYSSGSFLNTPSATTGYLAVAGTGVAAWSSTGLAVTGTLSSTGNYTQTSSEANVTLATSGQKSYSLISGGGGNLSNGYFAIRNNTNGNNPFYIHPTAAANTLYVSDTGVAVTGTGSFTGTGAWLSNTGAGTSNKYTSLANTVGVMYYGIESSAGASIISGTGAYSGVVAAANGLHLSGNGTAAQVNIDTSGNLLVGTTSAVNNPANGFIVANPTGTTQFYVGHTNGSGSGTYYATFSYNAGIIGSITQSGTTAVLYNTTSDERLKENIADAADAASLIDSIQVRQYDWKADGSHQRYGFVAQELVTVYPEAVHQPEDPEAMMAVDYSKLVPLLTKEIQSLRAYKTQAETVISNMLQRIAALEAK